MKLLSAIFLLFSIPLSGQTTEFINFQTDDNWQINAKYHNPENDKPVFILLHAQKKNLKSFKNIYRHFYKNGYGYIALDMRGHGDSLTNAEGSTETYKSFSIRGADNQFNKMTRDAEGAISFLSSQDISEDRMIIMGSVLGANLAFKVAAAHPDIMGVITLSAVFNVNDVLSVNPLKAYGKRPLLFIASANNKRRYKEFQILVNTAKLTAGEENVTTIIAKWGVGRQLLNLDTIKKILAWTNNPKLPAIVESSTCTAQVEFNDESEIDFENAMSDNIGEDNRDKSEEDREEPNENTEESE